MANEDDYLRNRNAAFTVPNNSELFTPEEIHRMRSMVEQAGKDGATVKDLSNAQFVVRGPFPFTMFGVPVTTDSEFEERHISLHVKTTRVYR